MGVSVPSLHRESTDSLMKHMQNTRYKLGFVCLHRSVLLYMKQLHFSVLIQLHLYMHANSNIRINFLQRCVATSRQPDVVQYSTGHRITIPHIFRHGVFILYRILSAHFILHPDILFHFQAYSHELDIIPCTHACARKRGGEEGRYISLPPLPFSRACMHGNASGSEDYSKPTIGN